MNDRHLKKMALALRRLDKLERGSAIDPTNLDARPSEKQQQILDSFGRDKITIVRGGNQCLAKGTLVMTSDGPRPIEEIQPGMTVYSEHGEPIQVKEVFANGIKPVHSLTNRHKLWAQATAEHRWLVRDFITGKELEKTTAEITEQDLIKQHGNPDYGVSLKVSEEVTDVETFDLEVDSPTHLYLLANGLVTHNSSKTTLGARTFSWMLSETHPTWKRPAHWKNERLQILVLGKSAKIIEESLYYRIKSYIDPAELHEFRAGNILQKVVHRPTGNTILFQSYENVNQARERIQSYTAHGVWIDEMPNSIDLFNEALRRIQAREGYFWATFTPLIVNNEIRSFCDHLPASQGQMYKIHMFDNPLYTPEKQKSILEEMALYPEHVRKCRLEGEWMSVENAVYFFDPNYMVTNLPLSYSPAWRHVESSDPAARSAHGMTVWAEDPSTGFWYCVKAEYFSGLRDTDEYVQMVKMKTQGLNIIRRIYDSACPWYADIAVKHGLTYTPVMHKSHRKLEMIKAMQMALGQQLFIAPWCQDLITEFTTMHWSETSDNKIARSHKYHLHDSAVYFLDCKPKYEGVVASTDYWAEMRQANQKRKVAEYKAKTESVAQRPRRRGIQHRGRVWGKPWR